MFRWLGNLFVLFCCLRNYGAGDCFYIFDVGQGNCQLGIYEEEKIGILFDCGTSSTKGHVKFSELQRSDCISIFEKKSSQERFPREVVPLEQLLKESQTMEEDPESLSQTSAVQCVERNLRSLSDLINSYDLKYLFIILSHPDKDHINLISSDLLSSLSPSVMILSEGDWFSSDKGEAQGVLQNLKSSQCAFCADFPFYSGGLLSIDKRKISTYERLLGSFEESGVPGVLSLLEGWVSVIPTLKFEDLYSVILRKSSEKANNLEYFRDILCADGFPYVSSQLFDVLKNVKIAHINFPFKDVNSQSSIVEIKMPKLKMQFFLTGDASDETFSRVVEYDRSFFKKDEGYISLAMLPHHGSKENKSMWFFELFQPDIIGISAGNGGQFTHPSKIFIDQIKALPYKGSFWENFTLKNLGEAGIFFLDKEKNDTPRSAFVLKNGESSMPFVCTNLLGDIKFDEQGIAAQFSNIVEEGGEAYEVNYLQSKNVTFSGKQAGVIRQASDGEFYFCVERPKSGDLCYPAKKLARYDEL